jgi:hypothetical protein
MSRTKGEVKREHAVGIALTADEKAALDALADRLQVSRAAVMRGLLQNYIRHRRPALPPTGRFVPVHAPDAVIPIRLSHSEASDD